MFRRKSPLAGKFFTDDLGRPGQFLDAADRDGYFLLARYDGGPMKIIDIAVTGSWQLFTSSEARKTHHIEEAEDASNVVRLDFVQDRDPAA